MSVEYVKALQDAARSGKSVVHEEAKAKETLDPKSPSSSDLPYHSAETEAIQAARAKELAAKK